MPKPEGRRRAEGPPRSRARGESPFSRRASRVDLPRQGEVLWRCRRVRTSETNYIFASRRTPTIRSQTISTTSVIAIITADIAASDGIGRHVERFSIWIGRVFARASVRKIEIA